MSSLSSTQSSAAADTLVSLANPYCRILVAPAIGGRIVSLQWRETGEELLWRNSALPLQRYAPDTLYDPHFYGGIDELLPCDLPETIDEIDCPDHGELWTTSLHSEMRGDALLLRGSLPRFGLQYYRRMQWIPDRPDLVCEYRISNPTAFPRHFLWKLHAALAVQPGDVIECPARWAQPVDAEYTTCPTMAPFSWPLVAGQDKTTIRPADGTCEFLYLNHLSEGSMGWRSPARRLRFTYHFDPAVFPYAWLFQSFGGFYGHYTTVLGPSTCMPITVNEARALGQCSVLHPGETVATTVRITIGAIDTLP